MKTVDSIYRQKLNGYRCTHRNRWLLISSGIVSLQALSLFEFYIDISDFDQNHKNHGTFQVNFPEIAVIFICSQGTIRNWHKELLNLELISPSGQKGIYYLSIPRRYTPPGFWRGEASYHAKLEKNQTAETILQSMTKSFESTEKYSQPDGRNSNNNLKKRVLIALGSSKDEYKSSLTKEDKQWLDKQKLE